MVKIGDSITKTIHVTEKKVEDFARVSGDNNPLHLDDNFASNTRFRKRVVQGMLLAGFLSSVIANDMPGPGTIYLEQNIRFTSPLYIGENLIIKVTCIGFLKPYHAYLSTIGKNENGDCIFQGEAIVIIPH